MPIKVQEELHLGPEPPSMAIVEIGRTESGEGIRVFVKSKFLHSWFKERSIPDPQEIPEWGIKVFRLNKVVNLHDATLTHMGGALNVEGALNLTWLRAINLDEGVTINFEGYPPAEPNINAVYNHIRKAISDLWANHMRKTTVKAKITFVELHDEDVA